jgi:hypothetical protein
MGRDHTLALYRAAVAGLFAAWVVVIHGVGAREAAREMPDAARYQSLAVR